MRDVGLGAWPSRTIKKITLDHSEGCFNLFPGNA